MKKVIFSLILSSVLLSSCSQLTDLLKPSNLETVMALREVLNSSTFRALKTLRDVNNNGIESALPREINTVLSGLQTLGYGDEISQVKKGIGDASLLMLNESEGIITDAIKEVKFTDAVSVVLGGEDAATTVLKNAMTASVKKRYSARMEEELGKTDALKYWPMAAGAYNLFASEKVDKSLSDFLAERAVDGMFLAMGKEEKKVRADYRSVGSAVVDKVFDYYTKNR